MKEQANYTFPLFLFFLSTNTSSITCQAKVSLQKYWYQTDTRLSFLKVHSQSLTHSLTLCFLLVLRFWFLVVCHAQCLWLDVTFLTGFSASYSPSYSPSYYPSHDTLVSILVLDYFHCLLISSKTSTFLSGCHHPFDWVCLWQIGRIK